MSLEKVKELMDVGMDVYQISGETGLAENTVYTYMSRLRNVDNDEENDLEQIKKINGVLSDELRKTKERNQKLQRKIYEQKSGNDDPAIERIKRLEETVRRLTNENKHHIDHRQKSDKEHAELTNKYLHAQSKHDALLAYVMLSNAEDNPK